MLKRGDRGPEVVAFRRKLERLGYPLPPPEDRFGPLTEGAVKEFQRKNGLAVTGVVDDLMLARIAFLLGEMDGRLPNDAIDTYAEVRALPALMPITALDKRISDNIMFNQTCDGGQGLRYGGWRNLAWTDAEFKKGGKFIVPRVGKIVPGNNFGLKEPVHGGTCSPFAGQWLSWAYCANQDYTRILAWNGAFLVDCSTEGEKVHNGDMVGMCRGFEEYFKVDGVRKFEQLPLNVLYAAWERLKQINVLLYTSHVLFILKVGGPDGLHLEDPKNPGHPMECGLLRYGADGFYPEKNDVTYYSGTKQTCRILTETEKVGGRWDIFCGDNMDPDNACPVSGRYVGRVPWAWTLAP